MAAVQFGEVLAEFSDLVDTSSLFPDRNTLDAMAQAVHKTLLNYSALTRYETMRGKVRWNIVPKHHYWAHLPRQALLINPRATRTYIEEGMIGNFTKIYAGIANGQYAGNAQKTTLTKSLVGLQLSFNDR